MPKVVHLRCALEYQQCVDLHDSRHECTSLQRQAGKVAALPDCRRVRGIPSSAAMATSLCTPVVGVSMSHTGIV
jgi:hypothetical protein